MDPRKSQTSTATPAEPGGLFCDASKLLFLVPLFDLRSLKVFAATDAGTSNRRH